MINSMGNILTIYGEEVLKLSKQRNHKVIDLNIELKTIRKI